MSTEITETTSVPPPTSQRVEDHQSLGWKFKRLTCRDEPAATDRKKPNEFTRRQKDLGPLHALLLQACPPDKNGIKSIPLLAIRLRMSKWGVFKWIKSGRVPSRRVAELVAMSEGRVALQDFAAVTALSLSARRP